MPLPIAHVNKRDVPMCHAPAMSGRVVREPVRQPVCEEGWNTPKARMKLGLPCLHRSHCG
jgi:hypothetical protein